MRVKTFFSTFAVVIFILAAVSACSPAENASGSTPTNIAIPSPDATKITPPGLSEEALKNAEYHSKDFSLAGTTLEGSVQLKDGKFEYIGPAGNAFMLTVDYERGASGDLNGDGSPDAAVILYTNTGGSGVFFYLAAVVNQQGKPNNVDTTFLGDRVLINSLKIQDGVIQLELTVQGPQDAMCCPSQKVSEEYLLNSNLLTPG